MRRHFYTPDYLCDEFTLCSEVFSYGDTPEHGHGINIAYAISIVYVLASSFIPWPCSTRTTDSLDVIVPKAIRNCFYNGAVTWNGLTNTIRESEDLVTFKSKYIILNHKYHERTIS